MKRKNVIQLSLFAPEPPEEETAEAVAATEPVDESVQAEEVEVEEIGPVFSTCIPAQPAAIAPATTLTIRLESLIADSVEELESAPTTQSPYGRCSCGGKILIPGLDATLCQRCGWREDKSIWRKRS